MSHPTTTRVLVVDDNVELLDVLCILLQSVHLCVEGARDYATAVAAAIRARPDICLIDMGLPDIDGYQLAADLHLLAPGAFLIGMSANARDLEREGKTGVRLSHFLEKPFSAETLTAALETALADLDAGRRSATGPEEQGP